MTESMGRPRGSYPRVDPAKHLDLPISELHHPVRQPAGRTPEEVSDGKQ